MERIIQHLVECDKKGQEIVREAQERGSDVLEHMNDFKLELSAQYSERAESRVEAFRQQAQAVKNEQLADARAHFEAQSGRLRASYEQNSGRWLQQMVDRCLDR